MIIPPSIFTSPHRPRRSAGGVVPDTPWWDPFLFLAAAFGPVFLMFAYMWYDTEYNLKPAAAKRAAEALAEQEVFKVKCESGGGKWQWERYQSSYDYKRRRPRYGYVLKCYSASSN